MSRGNDRVIDESDPALSALYRLETRYQEDIVEFQRRFVNVDRERVDLLNQIGQCEAAIQNISCAILTLTKGAPRSEADKRK